VRTIILASALALVSSGAVAQDWERLSLTYISGFLHGADMAEFAAEIQGAERVLCLPNDQSLAIDAIIHAIQTDDDLSGMQMADAVTIATYRVWACNNR